MFISSPFILTPLRMLMTTKATLQRHNNARVYNHSEFWAACLWITLSTPCLNLLGLFLLLRGIKMDILYVSRTRGKSKCPKMRATINLPQGACEGWENLLLLKEGSLGTCWMPAGLWLPSVFSELPAGLGCQESHPLPGPVHKLWALLT